MKVIDWDAPDEKTAIKEGSVEALSVDGFHSLAEKKNFMSASADTVELMLIGFLVGNNNPFIKEKTRKLANDTKPIDEIIEARIKGEWFEDKNRGWIFDELLKWYSDTRTKPTPDEAKHRFMAMGHTADNAEVFREFMEFCYSTLMNNRVFPKNLIKRFKNRHYCKKADDLFRKFSSERVDPEIGPEKAIENFKNSVKLELVDQSSNPIKETDWVGDYEDTLGWLLDMKVNPDKYAGLSCGIKAIDKKTNGLMNGHLTVFVGWHGGFKTTTMINVAFGLWEKGCNVLYVSLEMENKLMNAKFWCRGTKRLSYNKMYKGLLSQPSDWDDIVTLEKLIDDPSTTPETKKAAEKKVARLREGIAGIRGPEDADTNILEQLNTKIKGSSAKIKIINVGQSSKMKCSQLERYIADNINDWKPNVVIVDYLDLMAAENTKGDARWEELGDICKYLRSMGQAWGFSVVTAAQFKRGAIERIRKVGLDKPDKAQFSTDDIAGSNQIGADADNVFMLWRDGQDKLKIFSPKCRHGQSSIDDFDVLQVFPDQVLVMDESNGELLGAGIDSTMDMTRLSSEVVPLLIKPKQSTDMDDEEKPSSLPMSMDMPEKPRLRPAEEEFDI